MSSSLDSFIIVARGGDILRGRNGATASLPRLSSWPHCQNACPRLGARRSMIDGLHQPICCETEHAPACPPRKTISFARDRSHIVYPSAAGAIIVAMRHRVVQIAFVHIDTASFEERRRAWADCSARIRLRPAAPRGVTYRSGFNGAILTVKRTQRNSRYARGNADAGSGYR